MGRGQKWFRKQRTQRTYMLDMNKGGDAGGLGDDELLQLYFVWEVLICPSILNDIFAG